LCKFRQLENEGYTIIVELSFQVHLDVELQLNDSSCWQGNVEKPLAIFVALSNVSIIVTPSKENEADFRIGAASVDDWEIT